jgi:hypothetical protein
MCSLNGAGGGGCLESTKTAQKTNLRAYRLSREAEECRK